MFYGGILLIQVGIPLMIAGSIVARNNKKAIQSKNKDVSLSLGITNSGVGLVMRF